MVISHSKKFAFFHVPKTGGHTVTLRLKKFLQQRFKRHEEEIAMYHAEGKMHRYVSHPESADFFRKHRDYFSFSYVRNPWDRVFSYYLATNKKSSKETKLQKDISKKEFSSFLERVRAGTQRRAAHIMASQFYCLKTPQEIIGVDYVARFENFEQEFETIISRLNINKYELDYTVISNRSNFENFDYKNFYNQEGIDWVAKQHKDDLIYFHYTYE